MKQTWSLASRNLDLVGKTFKNKKMNNYICNYKLWYVPERKRGECNLDLEVVSKEDSEEMLFDLGLKKGE